MSTKRQKLKLWAVTQTCYVCGESIEEFSLATLEHIIPRSKGGTNQQANLALSHKICNEIKSNYTKEEIWRREIREIQKRKDFLIWRRRRSDFEIGILLERAFADLIWAQNIINSSFRFCEPVRIYEEDIQMQLNVIKKLRSCSMTVLIEASKKIDAYRTQHFWRLVFSICFIENYKKNGDLVALLHAIWRMKGFQSSIQTPIMFLVCWDLLNLCKSINPVAFERTLMLKV